MIIFRFIAFLLLGISCHAAPSVTNAPVRAYICDEGAALKIHLVIKQGGTYEASLEQPTGVRVESGVWTSKNDELVLKCRIGDIGHSIRRLRVNRQDSERLIWIVPGAGDAGGAVTYPVFHREVL